MTAPWVGAFLGLSAMTIMTALLVLGLMRRIGSILEEAETRLRADSLIPSGLPVGAALPPFRVRDSSDNVVDSTQVIRGPSVVLMLSPGCAPCRSLATQLRGASDPLGGVPLVTISDGKGSEDELAELGVPLWHDVTGFRALNNNATPFAYAIDSGGRVLASGVPASLEALQLLTRSLTQNVPGKSDSVAATG